MDTSSINWKDPTSQDGQTTITGTFTANGKNYEVSVVYNAQNVQSSENIPKDLTEKISKIGTESLAKLVGYTFKSFPKEQESEDPFQIFQNEKVVDKLDEGLKGVESEIHSIFNMFLSEKNEGIKEISTKPITLNPNTTIHFQEVEVTQDRFRKEGLLGSAIEKEKTGVKEKEEKEEQPIQKLDTQHEEQAKTVYKKNLPNPFQRILRAIVNNTFLARIFGKIFVDSTFDIKTGIVSCSKKQFFKAQKQLNDFLKENSIDESYATQYLQILLTGNYSFSPTQPELFSLTDLELPKEEIFEIGNREQKSFLPQTEMLFNFKDPSGPLLNRDVALKQKDNIEKSNQKIEEIEKERPKDPEIKNHKKNIDNLERNVGTVKEKIEKIKERINKYEKEIKECNDLEANIKEAIEIFSKDSYGRPWTLTIGNEKLISGGAKNTWNFLNSIVKKVQHSFENAQNREKYIEEITDSEFAKKLQEFHGEELFDEKAFLKVISKNVEQECFAESKSEGEKDLIQRFNNYLKENIIIDMSIDEICGNIKREEEDVQEIKKIIEKAWVPDSRKRLIGYQMPIVAGRITKEEGQKLAKITSSPLKRIQTAVFLKIFEVMIFSNQSFVGLMSSPPQKYATMNDLTTGDSSHKMKMSEDLNSVELIVETTFRNSSLKNIFRMSSNATFSTSPHSPKKEGKKNWVQSALVSPFIEEEDLKKISNFQAPTIKKYNEFMVDQHKKDRNLLF